MRLNSETVQVLQKIFLQVFGKGELYLFGSRVDDARKGGDIDLYLVVDNWDRMGEKRIEFLAQVKRQIGDQRQFLFIALACLFPLTVSGGTILGITLIVLWVCSGNYRSKYEQIVSNKLSLACIAFFALHLVGLLWTEDLDWGFHIVKKMYWLCLGLPILLTITQEDNRPKYLSAL